MKKALFCILPLLALVILSSSFRDFKRSQQSATNDSLPFFDKSAEYKAKNITSSEAPVTLITGIYNDKYQPDSLNKSGYLYVEVKVADLVKTSYKRIPLNISIVIDRSGSMAGDKIEFAKKAAKKIVDRLDSTDYVSVVVYDNFIDVLQKATPDSNKKEIKKRIDKMIPRGSTNLWGGTQKGYEEVMANYKAGFINRVLLISDGQANVGIINPKSINYKVQQYRDSGISLSTFGVGLDYNELLMTEMAETGTGNYYFIDSASKMTEIFEQELNSILSLAARKSLIKITAPKGIKLLPVSDDVVYEQRGTELFIKTEDLFSKDRKGFLFRFSIPDKVKNEMKFGTELQYINLADNIPVQLKNENLLSPVKEKKTYLAHFNEEVIDQVILQAVSDNMERALLLSDDGNYIAAREVLNLNNEYLKNNQFLVNRSAELQKVAETNQHYLTNLSQIKKLNKDAIKMLQKMNREALYELRNKKT